jgi:hypothetical protein
MLDVPGRLQDIFDAMFLHKHHKDFCLALPCMRESDVAFPCGSVSMRGFLFQQGRGCGEINSRRCLPTAFLVDYYNLPWVQGLNELLWRFYPEKRPCVNDFFTESVILPGPVYDIIFLKQENIALFR